MKRRPPGQIHDRTTLDIDHQLMVALRSRAEREHRTLRAQLEIVLTDWLRQTGDLPLGRRPEVRATS